MYSYSLDYVESYRKKIAYSASFGTRNFSGTEQQKEKMKSILARFNHLSVRETSGVEILKNEFQLEGENVLDPVLCCNPHHYDNLLENAIVRDNGAYMVAYLIRPYSKFMGLEKLADKLGNLGLVNILNADRRFIEREDGFTTEGWPYAYEDNCKVEDWLYYLANSSFICTDSFHAVCLAVIFRKNFVFIKGTMNENTGFDRIASLLTMLGIEGHIAISVQEVLENESIYAPIDYESVHERLKTEQHRSMNWLRQALDSEIRL